MILTVHYLSRIFYRAICIVWHCKSIQDPLGSKEVSIVSALYMFLFFHLFFLVHPSFQSGTNYNLFGRKMNVPGNCLPHSAISVCMILYCLWCCCCLCISVWTCGHRTCLNRQGKTAFLPHLWSRNKMRKFVKSRTLVIWGCIASYSASGQTN